MGEGRRGERERKLQKVPDVSSYVFAFVTKSLREVIGSQRFIVRPPNIKEIRPEKGRDVLETCPRVGEGIWPSQDSREGREEPESP